MSKIGRIAGKVNEKFDDALEGMSLTDPEQAKDASERDDPDQEYYEARSPEQIQEGGAVILSKGQVEERPKDAQPLEFEPAHTAHEQARADEQAESTDEDDRADTDERADT